MKMQTKIIWIVMIITLVTLASCATKPALAVNENSIEGLWQFSTDPSRTLVFYADTWRILDDGKIWGNMASGVFYPKSRNEIICLQLLDKGFLLHYTLKGNILTVNSVEGIDPWMVGTWNKIDTGKDTSDSNPLVGTWKVKDEIGISIFQFYSDGTARGYDYAPEYEILHTRVYYTYDINNKNNSGSFSGTIIQYDLERLDGSGTMSDLTSNYELNGDELRIHETVFKRQ